MTADFFVVGHFDQKMKNEKWNEPDDNQNKLRIFVVWTKYAVYHKGEIQP